MDKKRTGLIATLAVVLALVGVSNLPKKGGDLSTAAESKKSTTKKEEQNNKSEGANRACEEIGNRLQRFMPDPKFLAGGRYPANCYEHPPASPKEGPALSGVRFVIAIVPDPVTTHLPLMFDRNVEALQQAAQDEFYSYDSSWFPWDDTQKDYPLLSDELAASELKSIREEQPGVMVFRSAQPSPVQGVSPAAYASGLVIFLVGEQPTRGIADDQFRNAVAWIQTLNGGHNGETLNILGPTFSGSLQSLALQLARIKLNFHDAVVKSGSVSSDTAIQWFRGQGLADFTSYTESDSVMLDRFMAYLCHNGYQRRQIAILSEDETAFGENRQQSMRPSGDDPIYLYYPRDIASLRSAYEQQSIFSSSKPAASQNAPSTTLRGDLSEPANSDHDTVRSYGGQLTPLAQESVLLTIVSMLKEKQIQFVVVRSSNSLDQIFLSQFLHQSFPEGRVVLDGTDLLFRRGTDGASLRGVMTFSSYPLIGDAEDWEPPLRSQSSGYRVFGQDVTEGLYIAARELLRRDAEDENENQDKDKNQAVPIRDYAAPAWTVRDGHTYQPHKPSTWLSVISSRQFWPVAVLSDSTITAGNAELPPLHNLGRGAARMAALPFEMTALLLVVVAWSFWHWFCCQHGSMQGSPRALVYFAPLEGNAHKLLIFSGSLLLAILAVIVAFASGLFSPDLGTLPRLSVASATLLVAGFAFAACVANFHLPVLHGRERAAQSHIWSHFGAWLMIATAAAFGLAYYLGIARMLTSANRFPLHWRSVHILSGASPLLPQVLLIAGMYGWFWFTLHGLALSGQDRPVLPKREDLRLKDRPLLLPMFTREDAGDKIEAAAGLTRRSYFYALAISFVGTWLVWWFALRGPSIRSLGEKRFGILILLWLSMCMALALANTWQLLRAWGRLRQLLVFLDRIPLRRTLSALKGLAWGAVWKMGGNVFEERYRVISRQLESLRHLSNTLAAAPDTELSIAQRQELQQHIDDCQKGVAKFAEWYVNRWPDRYISDLAAIQDFQEQLAATAGSVMTNLLLPAWQKEKESLIFERSQTPHKKKDEDEDSSAIPPVAIPDYVRAAEEFFVLPYLGFIQNTLGRIRTILLGSLCVFIGATLAVASYPFDPRPVLAGGFVFVFALVGVAMTVVYAEMHRDATLSHITNTRPGELGMDFWLHIFTFGVGPLLGVLSTLFPSIADFVVSWLQPGMQMAK